MKLYRKEKSNQSNCFNYIIAHLLCRFLSMNPDSIFKKTIYIPGLKKDKNNHILIIRNHLILAL